MIQKINIQWPLAVTNISESDNQHPLLDENFKGIIIMECRFCKTELEHVFIDLVNSPASNSFLTAEQLNEPETFYPLESIYLS